MAAFVPTSRANLIYNVEFYDVFCVATAPWIAFALRDPRFFEPILVNQGVIYWCISLLVGLAILNWSGIGNMICRYCSAADCNRILLASFTSVSITSTVAFSVTRLDTIPRSLPIIHFFILGFLLIAGRLVRAALAREGRKVRSKDDKNIIVVGANHIASFYIRLIDKCAFGQQRVLAVVDPNPRLRNRTVGGHRVIGGLEDLPAILSEYKTHGITVRKLVVTIEEGQLSQSARECLHSSISDGRPTDIEFLSERLGLTPRSSGLGSSEEDGAALEPQAADIVALGNRGYWKLKRGIDIVVASSILVLLAPMFAAVALVVRIAIGSPVIFWQRRIGRFGAGVFVFKFRTMNAPFDADGRVREQCAKLCPTGRFLRLTRLDELPQLFNILRGDMSLIGPRPLLPKDQPADIGNRLLVLPGLTGWAQVNGGDLIGAEEKTALDNYYIRNASLSLDTKIVLKTLLIVITGDSLPEKRSAVAPRISR
jgi:lipopolysaccharide/colanic/teichoic acid biosynthesis glycosyltransferase